MRHSRLQHPRRALLAVVTAALALLAAALPHRTPVDDVVPNDNRLAAGHRHGDTLVLDLEARLGAWRPDLDVDSTVTVQVFAEKGSLPQIPGPLVRAHEGTPVVVNLRNALDSALVVYGLRGGSFADDTVQMPPHSERVVRFRLGRPGTYMYWGSTTKATIGDRPWRDSQLTGVIVVDPRGARPDTAERIFVITLIDLFPGDTVRNKKKEDVWDLAINGRSWPHTERFTYPVGTRVRWRWINGSYIPHPMHLHGFHFRVLAKGEDNRYERYTADRQPMVVTEFAPPGSSFAMEFTPTRAGQWLMHCHMIPHITPFPERPDSAHTHDLHEVEQHPMKGMAGLVLGITTVDQRGVTLAATPAPARRLRVFVQQARTDSGRKNAPHAYVLQREGEPRADSVEVPSSPLVLTRGERTSITVVNRLRRPTTVHWHGMELESVYDGVSGWSRSGRSVAPLVAPGDSFTVVFTPPRAGTYIYHTHIDEGPQLRSGLYAPLLVLEPGERYDPARDLTFVLGDLVENDSLKTGVNGSVDAPPVLLDVGKTYRLRFINMHFAEAVQIALLRDSVPAAWTPISKDGATLPQALRVAGPARLPRPQGVGETYDFELTPTQRGDLTLEWRGGPQPQHVLRRTLRVR